MNARALPLVIALLLVGILRVVGSSAGATSPPENAVSSAEVVLAAGHRGTQFESGPIPVPLDAVAPVLNVGSVWRFAAGVDLAAVRVSLRGSVDGRTWDDWLAVDHFHYLEDGRAYTHLLTFPAQTRFVQLRVDQGAVETVRLVFLSAGATAQSLPVDVAAVSALPVVSRSGWGCPEGESAPRWPPSYRTVTHLIVHHTATNPGTDYPAHVRAIWEYHANTLGWGDIGYNYLIAPDGTIFAGRAGGDGAVGAHFSCVNNDTLGIALMGNFSFVDPNPAARAALESLLAWKADSLSLDPLGSHYHSPSALTLPVIAGHRDGNSSQYGCPAGTVCPGAVLYSRLPAIRQAAADIVNAVPTVTPTPTPTATPTATLTPTATPAGFRVAEVTGNELLAALQAVETGTPLRVILVDLSRAPVSIYVSVNGVTGIVPVHFEWMLHESLIRFGALTTVNGQRPPASWITAVHRHLPGMLVAALDSLVAARFEVPVAVDDIALRPGLLVIGVVPVD